MANVTIKGLGLKGMKNHLKALLEGGKPGVKVGVMEGAKYDQGPLAGQSVAQNLARHEFGAKIKGGEIPARAPFRTTLARKKGDWAKEFAGYLASSSGQIDVKAALTQVGDAMAMDIQNSFDGGLSPALKPATIKQKMRITREGGRTEKNKRGKSKGQYKTGDYAANASTPVMLTGTAQRSITSEYVDDISTLGE